VKKILALAVFSMVAFGFEYMDCCNMVADVYLHMDKIPKPPVKTMDTHIEYHATDDEISIPVLYMTEKQIEAKNEE
jgi:hypothetical protein